MVVRNQIVDNIIKFPYGIIVIVITIIKVTKRSLWPVCSLFSSVIRQSVQFKNINTGRYVRTYALINFSIGKSNKCHIYVRTHDE